MEAEATVDESEFREEIVEGKKEAFELAWGWTKRFDQPLWLG